MTKCSVVDVAEAILRKSSDRPSSKKVQKLAYYAQAVHLARTGDVLVDDTFQAWRHGPVAPALYDRQRGRYAVPTVNGSPESLDDEAELTIELTLDLYGHLTEGELEALSHFDGPWTVARGALPMDAASREPIPAQTIRTMLEPKISRILAARKGPGVSAEEFMARFGQ